jgi:hypothetical protein
MRSTFIVQRAAMEKSVSIGQGPAPPDAANDTTPLAEAARRR